MNQAIPFILWIPAVFLTTGCRHDQASLDELTIPLGQITINTSPSSEARCETIIIFCGNPGVGKTTLCNSLTSEITSPSGLTIEKVMTTKSQTHMLEGTKYIDAAGLTDENLNVQAAEISSFLAINKDCNILFVITLESGRVRESDLHTAKNLLDRIQGNFNYHLIINKVTPRVMELLGKNNDILKKHLSLLDKSPQSTTLISFDPSIHDAENAIFSPHSEPATQLHSFIKSITTISFPKTLESGVNTFSEKVINFIVEHEGLSLTTYKDLAGHSTIGYGHLITKGENIPQTITKEQAFDLLKNDLRTRAAIYVTRHTKTRLYQHEFDALTSFTFNLGGTNLERAMFLKIINEGQYRQDSAELAKIRDSFYSWNKARINGELQEVKGLTNRRHREYYMFVKGGHDQSIYNFDWNKDYKLDE